MTSPALPVSTLRRILEILHNEGPRSLYFKILGETVYRRLILLEKDMGLHPEASREDTLDCRLLEVGDLDEYTRYKADVEGATILERLERGDVCFLVRESGEIIHSCWTATGRTRIDYLECDVRLAADAVYVYEVFTGPRCRGRSVSSERSRQMQQHFLDRGLRRLVAAVWPENRAALRSAEKAGYRVTGRIGYRGAGPLRRHFCYCPGDNPALQLVVPATGY